MAPEARTFGQLLRHYRLAARLTQAQLAARAHVSSRTISDLERGATRTPRRDTAMLLAEALELPASARGALVAAARPAEQPHDCSAPSDDQIAPEGVLLPTVAAPPAEFSGPQTPPAAGGTLVAAKTPAQPSRRRTLARSIYVATRIPATAIGVEVGAAGVMARSGGAIVVGVAYVLLAIPAWWLRATSDDVTSAADAGGTVLEPGVTAQPARRTSLARRIAVLLSMADVALGLVSCGVGLTVGFWPAVMFGLAVIVLGIYAGYASMGLDVPSPRDSRPPHGAPAPPRVKRHAEPTPPNAGRARMDSRAAIRDQCRRKRRHLT